MSSVFDKYNYNASYQQGFTLIEVLIAVAIIGIMVAIAIPSYTDYVTEARRTDMMSELQNIASQIEAQKIIKGSYTNIELNDIFKGTVSTQGQVQYPDTDNHLYTLGITPITTGSPLKMDGNNWKLIAEPNPNNVMAKDGKLTLDYKGEKCHKRSQATPPQSKCSNGNDWQVD